MSMAVKYARANYSSSYGAMGDPGLFSFVGKALKGVAKVAGGALGGFLKGGVAGAVTGGLGAAGVVKGKPAAPPVLMAAPGFDPMGRSAGFLPVPPPRFTGISLGGPGGVQIGTGTCPGLAPGAPSTYVNGNGQVCRGHMNRTAYHLRDGTFVAPGQKCVSNRRMNPLNPRALSKAMRRIVSAKRAASVLNRISIRSCAPARRRASSSGKSCGCKRK